MRDENEIWCLKYDQESTMFTDIRLKNSASDSSAPATDKPVVSKVSNGKELRIEKWIHDVPYAIFGNQQKDCDFGMVFIIPTVPDWMHCDIFNDALYAMFNTEEAKKAINQLTENTLAIKLQEGVSYANETEDMADAAETLCAMVEEVCDYVKSNHDNIYSSMM